MSFATINGIRIHYLIQGAGPHLLMFAPGGWRSVISRWTAAGRVEVLNWDRYVEEAKALLELMPQSELWEVLPPHQTGENTLAQILRFASRLDSAVQLA